MQSGLPTSSLRTRIAPELGWPFLIVGTEGHRWCRGMPTTAAALDLGRLGGFWARREVSSSLLAG